MVRDDGERFLPEIMGGITALEHVHRYLFALQLIPGRRVLDIASGEGYGTSLLADRSVDAWGVEICAAIRWRMRRYTQDQTPRLLSVTCDRANPSKTDMQECSKSIVGRLTDTKFSRRCFVGKGVGIVGKPGPLASYQCQFECVQSIRTWDREDGDAQYMASAADGQSDCFHNSTALNTSMTRWSA